MLQHGPCSFVHAAGYAGSGLNILSYISQLTVGADVIDEISQLF